MLAAGHPIQRQAHSSSWPEVSVIVPTRNSSLYLERCLRSIFDQTYPNIQLIVVDNHSDDSTCDIARLFTPHVYVCGPERSAQVNHGASVASGEFVFRVDADFELAPTVVEQCVERSREGYDAVVVHNSPDSAVSWIAQIRKFEVDMYKYDLTHSAARFIRKTAFIDIEGFDEALVAGEDYDLQNRLTKAGIRTGFIEAEAVHLGEPAFLLPLLVKYLDYGRTLPAFRRRNPVEARRQLALLRTPYLKHWRRFAKRPLMALAFLTYHVCKFTFGLIGYLIGSVDRSRARADGGKKREGAPRSGTIQS